MAQVKFYSVSASAAKTDANGVYFVDGGELYKGTQRFGLGRVTVDAAFNPSTSSKDGQAKGDIVVTGSGAGWVFDGTNWQSIGGDISSLQSMWQNDIKTWTGGLVSTAQGDGTYIKQITKDADGKVSAEVSNFATDVLTAVGNGTASSSSNGVTVSVTTTSGKVTGVSVTAPAAKTWTAINVGNANSYIYNVTQGTDGQVSASAAAFPTLGTGTTDGTVKLGSGNDAKVSGWDTVKTDIANLKAVVSYSGSGDKVVTASTVTATTGNFTNLNVTDTATFVATTVSASSLTVGGSTIEQIADSRIAAISSVTQTGASNGFTVSVTTSGGSVTAVSVDASTFGNVMRFTGIVTELPSSGNTAGDIVVIGPEPTVPELVEGQEYIYDGYQWELIGDQNTYALNAYSSTATVYTGAKTLPAAVSKAGAAIDALKTKTDAYVGGSASDSDQGVAVTVSVDASTLAPSVDVVVTSATLFDGLDASVSSSENSSIKVGVTQVDGKVTAVTADLLWLDANGTPVA